MGCIKLSYYENESSLKVVHSTFSEHEKEEGRLFVYGMRYYAPWMCRFVSVDPLAVDYKHYSPYQYAGNKPINYIDLDGAEEMKPPLETKQKGDTQPFFRGDNIYSIEWNKKHKVLDTFKLSSPVKEMKQKVKNAKQNPVSSFLDFSNGASEAKDALDKVEKVNKIFSEGGSLKGKAKQVSKTISKASRIANKVFVPLDIVNTLNDSYETALDGGLKGNLPIAQGQEIKDLEKANFVIDVMEIAASRDAFSGTVDFALEVANYALDGTIPHSYYDYQTVTIDGEEKMVGIPNQEKVDKLMSAYQKIKSDMNKDASQVTNGDILPLSQPLDRATKNIGTPNFKAYPNKPK